MTALAFGGKTTLFFFYFATTVFIYCFLLLKKRIPIYITMALLVLFEIFNYIYPVLSTNYTSSYISSLFTPNGNLFITVKTAILIFVIILSIITFSIKNKYLKIIFRIISIIFPLAFIVFEFITLSNTDVNDILNFTEKAEMSLLFDFLRFTPIVALSFLPSEKK